MNSTVYIFGNLSSGYTQYPEDYSKNIFSQFHDMAKSISQIAIHREEGVMYYGYIRKLEQDKYIGLCVLLNNLMITRFDNLFSLFENTIEEMVNNGLLIKFDDYGKIVPNANKLYLNHEELDLISETLKAGFNNLENYSQRLPPVNYGIKKNSIGEFSFEDSVDEIIKSTYNNGFTIIYKSKDYNTIHLNSYKGVLERISKENDTLKTDIEKLKKQNQKILKQKKQIKKVYFLILVVIVCGVGLFYLNNNLTHTENQLHDAKYAIRLKTDTIKNKDSLITDLDDKLFSTIYQLNDLKNKNTKLQEEFKEYKDKIIKLRPFLFEGFSFNPYTGRLTIKYYGLIKDFIRIRIYLRSNTDTMFYSKDIYLNIGSNETDIYINKVDENASETYYFEIIYDKHIIGGGLL